MQYLLTTNQAKMLKSIKYKHESAVLHLSARTKLSAGNYTCLLAESKQCFPSCIEMTGHGRLTGAQRARLERTELFRDNRDLFMAMLHVEIKRFILRCEKNGSIPTIRLNGTSDLPWEDYNVIQQYPNVQFIDYTKAYSRMFKQLPSNYHLTYSINNLTPKNGVKEIYENTRFNCCQIGAFKEIPKQITYDGYTLPIVSGDDSDLRHLDPRGSIVWLKLKTSFSRKDGKKVTPSTSSFILSNEHVEALKILF